MDVHVLHQQGLSIRPIAKQLGISRNTVCAYLRDRQKMPVYTRCQVRPTKLQPYQDYLRSRIEAEKTLLDTRNGAAPRAENSGLHRLDNTK